MAPTIGHVAKAALVSRATVSRAFGAPHLLNPKTVDHVRAVAERLGYTPNPTARALSTGRSGNLALVVPDITNAFFAAIMRGAQARAREAGYATFVGDSDETPELEDSLLSRLTPQVEGFVFVSPRLAPERIIHHAGRRPMVVINSDAAPLTRLLVDTGPSYGRAVEHLADLGHRQIAYVAGPERSWSNAQRGHAVREAAERRGVHVLTIATERPDFEAGRRAATRLVEAGVTAALAFDDSVAQGLVAGLAEQDLAVPDDLSIVGCDGIIAPTVVPALTSIDAHCREVGERAIDLLLAVMAGSGSSPHAEAIATDFVVRDSTGPVRSVVSRQLRAARRAVAGNHR